MLIEALESSDQERIVPLGFAEPHSYSGNHSEIAFTPAKNVTIASMLANARSALGATFKSPSGYSYYIDKYTPCYIANRGDLKFNSDKIGPVLVAYLCGKEHEQGETK